MEISHAQIDISPEREAYITQRIASIMLALESGRLTIADRDYFAEEVPKLQAEIRLIPKIRQGLERSYHTHAA
jgi:hypothetical protein